VLLDHTVGPVSLGRTSAATESALTFTTYMRRFTQCLTTLAAVGAPGPDSVARMRRIAARLDAIAASLLSTHHTSPSSEPWLLRLGPSPFSPTGDLAEQMLQRMERQAGVLERAAATLQPGGPSLTVSS
jgi:hypothetical protein